MDALTKRLGTRFLVVTVLPNVLFTAYVGFLLAAGAPTHSPSLAHALKVLDALTVRQIIVLLVAVLIISVAIESAPDSSYSARRRLLAETALRPSDGEALH